MNKVILMGRLTRDPEMRQTASAISVCSFTLAVDRRFKSQDGERKADFINIVAWRQLAEFANAYLRKGQRTAVVGSLQTRSWEDANTGQRRYATEVIADEIHFADSKQQDSGGARTQTDYRREEAATNKLKQQWGNDDDFIRDLDDEESLPFDMN
jgi:single-strand DNA-binding protein